VDLRGVLSNPPEPLAELLSLFEVVSERQRFKGTRIRCPFEQP